MSVIMMMRAKADPAALEAWANTNADRITRIADSGREAGCIHHMFTAAKDEIVIIDEWPDEASFKRFFESQQDIPNVMAAAGVKGEPQVTYLRKMSMPDEF
jgi:quinol monooxygenase YgiN